MRKRSAAVFPGAPLGLLFIFLYLAAWPALSHPAGLPQGQKAAVAADPAARAAAPDNAAAVAETRTYLSRLERLGFAGVVLVARGDDPVFAEGFGLADRERGLRWTPGTVSTIGSITKQFTGAAILELEEDGRLAVADPIGRYFPDVPADKSAITLHHLLTHSSGLADPEKYGDFTPVDTDTYVRAVLAQPLLFKPGDGYEYANANFSLLGVIIEKLSGGSYETFLRKRLFLPAGMYETGYLGPAWGEGRLAQGYLDGKPWGTVLGRPMAPDGPYWALRGNGGLHSTSYDMLRWARALLGGRVLSAASLEKYWAPHVSEGGDTFYGYGWSIATGPGGAKVVTHNGGNGIFFADMAIVPEAGFVAFLMTNVISETRVANSLLEQIGARFLAGEAYPAIPEAVTMDPSALASFAGTYKLPGGAGVFRLTMDGEALFIDAEGRQAFAMLHSVRDAEPGRLDKLDKLMDRIIAANRAGDFGPWFEAYGGRVPKERLKTRWPEIMGEIEGPRGRLLRHEVLGSARTQERDETVIRFHCERGTTELTYVWDIEKEGRLLGMSMRGLGLRLRLYPSGERELFTWDGGLRPPKIVRLGEAAGPAGGTTLTLGDSKIVATAVH